MIKPVVILTFEKIAEVNLNTVRLTPEKSVTNMSRISSMNEEGDSRMFNLQEELRASTNLLNSEPHTTEEIYQALGLAFQIPSNHGMSDNLMKIFGDLGLGKTYIPSEHDSNRNKRFVVVGKKDEFQRKKEDEFKDIPVNDCIGRDEQAHLGFYLAEHKQEVRKIAPEADHSRLPSDKTKYELKYDVRRRNREKEALRKAMFG